MLTISGCNQGRGALVMRTGGWMKPTVQLRRIRKHNRKEERTDTTERENSDPAGFSSKAQHVKGVCGGGADIQENFSDGLRDCGPLSASAPAARRGCAHECDEIL